jgi:hypothetical protein
MYICSSTTQKFFQLPVAALPIVFPHEGTLYYRLIKFVIALLHFGSVCILLIADSCNHHTPLRLHMDDGEFTVYTYGRAIPFFPCSIHCFYPDNGGSRFL